jgi:hypothetical protein
MPFSPDAGPFWLLLAVTVVAAIWNARRADPAELLWVVTFAYLAVTTQRSAALFALVAAPVVARCLHQLLPVAAERAGRAAAPILLGLLVVQLLLVGPAMRQAPGRPGYGVDWGRFPEGACDFIAREDPQGEMFNHWRFGGYLGWRFFPDRLVFVDGKHIPYVPFLRRLEEAQSGGPASWQALMSELDVGYALLSYDYAPQGVVYGTDERGAPILGHRAWSAVWFHREEWALVYWDDAAMLFVRRDGPNAALVERFEYPLVNPEDGDYLVEQVRKGLLDPLPLLQELHRRLNERPVSARAGVLYTRLRDAADAAWEERGGER